MRLSNDEKEEGPHAVNGALAIDRARRRYLRALRPFELEARRVPALPVLPESEVMARNNCQQRQTRSVPNGYRAVEIS